MTSAVIVDAVRTPSGRGKPGGQLSGVHPVDLLAQLLAELVRRNGLDPATVDDVIGGCVSQAREQSANITRSAVLAAGFPERVPATTVDRQCGSSQQAAHFAAQGVMAGAYDVVIACGVESMSRVPMMWAAQGQAFYGGRLRARYPDGLVGQGISAELIAARWKLNREDLDAYSARSHALADEASRAGQFRSEIVPVPTIDRDGADFLAESDETVRPQTTAEGLAGLPPSFVDVELGQRYPGIEWSITAGSSSPLTDGASAVLIMSEERAQALGLRPRARFSSFAVVGDDPLLMLTGVVPATTRVLVRAGLSVHDIGVFEVNEAFASVPLAWLQETGADPTRLNQRGGAIALGHPLGASGTKLLATMLKTMEETQDRYGLQTMCEGGGMANAMVIELL